LRQCPYHATACVTSSHCWLATGCSRAGGALEAAGAAAESSDLLWGLRAWRQGSESRRYGASGGRGAPGVRRDMSLPCLCSRGSTRVILANQWRRAG
jgi:hypothetical protein